MDKKNLAFDKMNFILLAIGMAIVIIGFLLMSGAGSNEHTFDTDISIAHRCSGGQCFQVTKLQFVVMACHVGIE